jgi:hypothetical protein
MRLIILRPGGRSTLNAKNKFRNESAVPALPGRDVKSGDFK